MTRHTISVLVENKFGVLARIAGLFSGRGYNIHTLNVAPSQDPEFSRMTIVVNEKAEVLDQIIKQLHKLVNVVEVIDFRGTESVYRELVLMRIRLDGQNRSEVLELCQIFKADIVDVSINTLTIEFAGDEPAIERFLCLTSHLDVELFSRSGRIALPKPGLRD